MGERQGSYPGMPAVRTLCVKVIDSENPAPYDPDDDSAVCVQYDGKLLTLGL